MAGSTLAVFLDYDGTLTPIVDRPEDAVITEQMRATVEQLAERCLVCVVSGRDRRVVQDLMGIRTLIVAGSHGFDIWSPQGGVIAHQKGAEHSRLLAAVTERLGQELAPIEGALLEPKKASVAVHYRMVAEEQQRRVTELVETILDEHADNLKLTPGKMVYEIQPKLEWDKGKAVHYLLEALDLDRPGVVPIYLGDDLTDEDAFSALAGIGMGIFVGRPDDPEVGNRTTAADYILYTVDEVETFLRQLAALAPPR